jgi:hypothetical protein
MLARGHYEAKSKFIDDDKTVHKEWSWVSEQTGHRIIDGRCYGTIAEDSFIIVFFFCCAYSLSTSRRTGKEISSKSRRADTTA